MATIEVIRIADPYDDQLTDYTRLTDTVLRSRHEPAQGMYIAESSQVIKRALQAGHHPRSFLMAPRWLDDLAPMIAELNVPEPIPVYVGEADVLTALTGFHLHRGALAAMYRPALPTVAELVQEALMGSKSRLVIIEDVVDHTNMGAIFRSAAALGVDGVLISPRCADPLYRRSVRVSMGTVFQVPWTRISDWSTDVAYLRHHGFSLAALALAPDAVPLDVFASDSPAKLAIMLGTEGDGLSSAALTAADDIVTIPMSGGVDSLNVAAASAVALWALRP